MSNEYISKCKRITLLFIILYSLFIGVAQASDTLTILFTHDLHANVKGYARLATAIRQVRDKAPEHTLVLDAGDVAMGTFFQTLFTSHFAELRLMQAMGYDATTLGNHDFDFGVDALQQAIQNYELHVTSYELQVEQEKTTLNSQLYIIVSNLYGLPHTRDYLVVEKGGHRIGIFGLLGKEALSESLIEDGNASLTYVDPIVAARRMVKLLRDEEEVDLIICLSHSGTHPDKKHSEDEQLAQKVAAIDLIISGHSHTTLHEPLVVNRTFVGSVGAYGQYLGAVRIVLNSQDAPVFTDYRLIKIDENIPESPGIQDEIRHYQSLIEQNYLQPLGIQKMDDRIAFNSVTLSAEGNTLGCLVADAFRAAGKQAEGRTPDLAVVPRGILRADLCAGKVTPESIFNILSLGRSRDSMPGYSLLITHITGKEIRDLCEVDVSISNFLPDAKLFFSGLRYEYNPNSLIFNRVKKIELVDSTGRYTEVEDDSLYSVVCELYTAKMVGLVKSKSYGILSVTPKNTVELPVTGWIALKNYLQTFPVDNTQIPNIRFTESLSTRKICKQGLSLTEEFNYLNTFALCIYIIIVLLNITLLLLIYIIIRKTIKCIKKTSVTTSGCT